MRHSFTRISHATARRLYIAGGFVLVLILLTTLLIRFRVDPFVKNRLQTLVYESSGGLYRLEIERISLNPITATVEACRVRLSTDSARWESLRDTTSGRTPLRIELAVDKIVLSDLGWFRYWRERHARIGSMEFIGPKVQLTAVKDSVLEKEPQPADSTATRLINRLPGLIRRHATSLEIGTLALRSGAFDYETVHRHKSTRQRADSIDWVLTRVRIADSDSTLTGKAFYAENLYFRLRNYELETPDGHYDCRIGEAELLSVDQLLTVRDIAIRPQAAASRQRTRYDADIRRLEVRGLNLFRALHRDEWVATRVTIERPRLTVELDKNRPPRPGPKKMPHELVQRLPVLIDLDTLSIQHGRILYHEKRGENRGELAFEQTSLTVLHLSNDRKQLRVTRVFADTRLAGEGDLSVAMELPLLADSFACRYSARLRNLPVTALNDLLAAPGKIRLESGYINDLTLQAEVRQNVATGRLEAAYGGLRVSVLDERTGENKPLLSMLANLVLRNNNKRNGALRPFKTAEIRYARLPDDSFLRFLWRSARSGLLETLLPPGMPVPPPNT